jgi:fumarate hydratase, class II
MRSLPSERKTRTEYDTLGAVEVPSDRRWGAQTQRSLEHFRISQERMPQALLRALALVKWAAANVNAELGALDPRIAAAIARAADEVIAGQHHREFPLVVWQTGSGTQTNMNMNEVLANRACELLGAGPGSGLPVNPNDHVNLSQSSNDVFPTAMSLAAFDALRSRLEPAIQQLRDAFLEKSDAFADVIKLGRTHLMDATPLTLGQEIGGWAHQLTQALVHIEATHTHLSELAIGGTAVGTGLNAPSGYAEAMARPLALRTQLPVISAPNKFEALAAHDALVFAHGALKTLAGALAKIANDVRWLVSGPRSGLGELFIPSSTLSCRACSYCPMLRIVFVVTWRSGSSRIAAEFGSSWNAH